MKAGIHKIVLLAVILSLGWVGPLSAKTRDSQTPAEESVCDELLGGTPGLYGLCVAFCEAQDIDSIIAVANDGGVPGEKLLARYRAKMRAGDPDMPCLVSGSECPCFSVSLCEQSGGLACEIDAIFADDLFAGQTCGVTDTCQNSDERAQDTCVSDDTTPSLANAIVLSFGNFGFCSAQFNADTENLPTLLNASFLDGETAALCREELDFYDGNTAGEVEPCFLGGL